jgi:hypothetical protein
MPRVCWEEQLCVPCEFATINSRCVDFLRSTTILYTQLDALNSDVILVDNFR